MIQLTDVQKSYQGEPAIYPLTLEIPEGHVFGLLGPNGAGKTTLLRLIMGVLVPDSGRITLFGRYTPGERAASRLIGYMPQRVALYDGLSVAENIRFFGRLYGMEPATLERRLEEVLVRVELSERRHTQVGKLSGGMQRRAMLASTLIHRPQLLILDEPTAGVDPVLRLEFWAWFYALAEEGTTILVTTHHISEARNAGEVLFLRAGRLLDRGPPEELIGRYQAADLEEAFVRATHEPIPDPETTP